MVSPKSVVELQLRHLSCPNPAFAAAVAAADFAHHHHHHHLHSRHSMNPCLIVDPPEPALIVSVESLRVHLYLVGLDCMGNLHHPLLHLDRLHRLLLPRPLMPIRTFGRVRVGLEVQRRRRQQQRRVELEVPLLIP